MTGSNAKTPKPIPMLITFTKPRVTTIVAASGTKIKAAKGQLTRVAKIAMNTDQHSLPLSHSAQMSIVQSIKNDDGNSAILAVYMPVDIAKKKVRYALTNGPKTMET
eukprot:gnl/MRDRNA2_/MRDRNA2_399723_c0_seq1.p2 gnl/MRDRNA2_/MRDRNA2_399723_c0~~gnl/MRDRNA2_/MRDRNA2_399723_c0_seq1.p2  ORF type:complete len:107 (-),score=16.55 gnl/MRDRNA2_/MRDRNA2_399723_c0_seq1:273-593(-)